LTLAASAREIIARMPHDPAARPRRRRSAAAARPVVLSAGIIAVFRGPEDHRYLLLRCYRNWDFPKGEVQPGEDPLAAALRELKEETTLSGVEFCWGEDARETEPYARGKVARYYLAETKSQEVSLPVNPSLGIPEHHAFCWALYEEARALLADRLKPILDWAEARVAGR